MYMNIVDRRIEDPRYYYDPVPVEGWIKYCEAELTLTDGSDQHMLDSFKLWGEDVFGWYEYVSRSVWIPGVNGEPGHYEIKRIKQRLINVQYLIVGRSAAKSVYKTDIQAYFLNIDGYKSRASKSTTIALTPEQHAATKSVYRDWLYERTGNKEGGKVDWTSVSPQEAQALAERMFDAANVPLSARNDYYREFNRYIYGLVERN